MRKHTVMKKCLSVCLALLLCGLPVSIYASNETAQTAALPEQKISDTLYAEFARLEAQGKNMANEKIPVWIWYKDINQTQVDNIVKTRTGLTAENAGVDYAMPSPALLNSLQNEEPGSQAQMQAYLAATAQARALEAQRADTLIMTRREVAREQYNVKSAGIIEEANLDADDIIFKSQYAPMVIAKMTQKQIKELVKNENTETVSLYNADIPVDQATLEDIENMTSIKQTLGVNKVYNEIGLTGQNVKIGMFESGVPIPNSEITFTTVGTGLEQRSHATNSARAIASSEIGIAPDVTLYATNYLFFNIESMLTTGVKVINGSATWVLFDNSVPYTFYDKWFDHLVAQHNVTLICSAGNYAYDEDTQEWIPYPVGSPAMAYNTVAIGAYNEKKTGTILSDDSLFFYSSHDHRGGCEKPDIIAPANALSGGTSTSAPIVTGIVALMLEFKPSLAYQPHVIKAILLASCQRKVQNPAGVTAETMAQGITDRQGAGAVDAWNAICIISQGQYGYGTLSSEATRHFVQPLYGASHMNVSVTWLRNNTASGDHTSVSNVTAGTQHNIHLQVYRGETLAGSSALANSSTEMAYIPLSSTSNQYKLRLYKADSTNTQAVKYAYAWSTNNMTYKESASTVQSAPTDGFFYIRNQNTGQYLTVNESTGQVTSAAFSGGRNQQWIIDKADSTRFTIKTRSLTYPGNLSRAASGSNAVIDADTEYLIQFDQTTGTGAYAIGHSDTGTSFQYLQYTGGQFKWATYGAPTNFQWDFERVVCHKGDVNLDGSLSTADVLLLQQYVGKSVSFNDDQLYLGDLNNSGTVTVLDVSRLQQLLANA